MVILLDMVTMLVSRPFDSPGLQIVVTDGCLS